MLSKKILRGTVQALFRGSTRFFMITFDKPGRTETDMEHSEAYMSFKNKMLHFQDDVEIIDIFYKEVKEKTWKNKGALFDTFDEKRHKNISRYRLCNDNRNLIVTHLRATLYAAYVKELYEEMTAYLKNIILESYCNAMRDPGRIVGEHSFNMSAIEILKAVRTGNIEKVIIDNIFQSLESERSTISLIKKVCKKIGIEVDKELIDRAVFYLDIRHKLVHTDGRVDESFKREHPTLKYTAGNYIKLTYKTLLDMEKAVFTLVDVIDTDCLKKGLLKDHLKK